MNILDRITHCSYNNVLLTFDIHNELAIKKILSFIPNKIEFDLDSEEFGVDFDIFKNISILREIKLNYLNNQNTYIILDINKIPVNKDGIFRSKILNSFIRSTFSKAYQYNNSDNPLRVKIIILSNLYATMDNMGTKVQNIGGSQLLYHCDLVVQVLGKNITIIKDYNLKEQKMNISNEIRDIVIDNLISNE